jgi:hypothetical protein
VGSCWSTLRDHGQTNWIVHLKILRLIASWQRDHRGPPPDSATTVAVNVAESTAAMIQSWAPFADAISIIPPVQPDQQLSAARIAAACGEEAVNRQNCNWSTSLMQARFDLKSCSFTQRPWSCIRNFEYVLVGRSSSKRPINRM